MFDSQYFVYKFESQNSTQSWCLVDGGNGNVCSNGLVGLVGRHRPGKDKTVLAVRGRLPVSGCTGSGCWRSLETD